MEARRKERLGEGVEETSTNLRSDWPLLRRRGRNGNVLEVKDVPPRRFNVRDDEAQSVGSSAKLDRVEFAVEQDARIVLRPGAAASTSSTHMQHRLTALVSREE
jgi:hypothetical protein